MYSAYLELKKKKIVQKITGGYSKFLHCFQYLYFAKL